MILNLTDLSDEPLQAQIVRQIRARILSGELSAGEALPSIRGLARQTQVSVITVQRAYEALERDQLIHSRRGKGFFVLSLASGRKKDMARERLYKYLEPILKSALDEGLTENEIMEEMNKIIKART